MGTTALSQERLRPERGALGAEKVVGLNALGREHEQVGGYAPAGGGQDERDLGVKLGELAFFRLRRGVVRNICLNANASASKQLTFERPVRAGGRSEAGLLDVR